MRILADRLEEAFHQISDDALRMMQNLTPVRTGFLQSSESAEVYRDGDESVAFELRAAASYAPYVEYGTYKMSAQPFMRPTYYDLERTLPDRLRRALGDN